MKKRLLKFFVVIVLAVSGFALVAACNTKDYSAIAGTYSLYSFSDTYQGTYISDVTGAYNYFDVVLQSDGKAIVRYSLTDGETSSGEGTFTYDETTGALVISYGFSCLSAKEEMTLEDQTITYHIVDYEMDAVAVFKLSGN